jgi:hypothetical protein
MILKAQKKMKAQAVFLLSAFHQDYICILTRKMTIFD